MIQRKFAANTWHGHSMNLDEIELKEVSKPHGISTSHLPMHRLTANGCHSLIQRQLPQLPNVIPDQQDSPLLHSSFKDSADVHNTYPLKVRKSPKIKILATPE